MLVKTKKNCYYYSQKLKKILLLHPILYQIVKVKGDIEKIKRWLDTKKSFTTIQPSMNKIEYYYQKYQLLKDNEYFEMPILQKKNFFRYKASDIEYHLCGNRHVIFEVTENCNLKCKYCGYGGFYSNYSKRYNRNLSFKKAKILIDYMVKHWNFNENRSHNAEIRIDFYGGEPLLNFSFIRKMVRYINGIKLKHNYFTFGITTNGVLLDRYMNFLVEHEFRMLISLDGDENCNGYRVFSGGRTSYSIVYRNIILLRDRFPEYFKKHVNFSAVLHRLNSVERIYNFFKKTFDKRPQISELAPIGIKESMKEAFVNMYVTIKNSLSFSKDKLKIEIDMLSKTPRGRKLIDFLYYYSSDTFKQCHDLIPNSSKNLFLTGSCIPLNERFFLTASGKILPCERVSHKHVMGYVSNGKIHIDFEGIARKYNTYFESLSPICETCFKSNGCANCILQMETKNNHIDCRHYKSHSEFKKELSEALSFLEENPDLYKRTCMEIFFE